MSSDTFHVEIRAIAGDRAELLCTTSTAGGVNDYAVTRSFALMALEDGMPYAGENPLQRELRVVGGATPPVWEEAFHREHVGKFIARTELVERIGIVRDERAWREGRFGGGADAEAEQQFPLHKFVLRVHVTDPRWLEGLTPGDRWGTTAFDAWWDDPLRPTSAQLAEVERRASVWPVRAKAAKKTAAKKTTAKKSAKKTAAKKSAKKTAAKKSAKKAAKKTTAKKTAAKKSAKKTAAKKTRA